MTDHPLTDAGEQLMPRFFTALDRAIDAQRDAFKESISEALKLGIETGRNEQLEQVMKWLNETIFERGSCLEAVNIPEELAEAMRPTTQEDNS